jgi:hypothetical protein
MRLTILEGRLTRRYRKLQTAQAREARVRSKRVLYDVADTVLQLQAVVEAVEDVLEEAEQHRDE